jgi:hypothetical protein
MIKRTDEKILQIKDTFLKRTQLRGMAYIHDINVFIVNMNL